MNDLPFFIGAAYFQIFTFSCYLNAKFHARKKNKIREKFEFKKWKIYFFPNFGNKP